MACTVTVESTSNEADHSMIVVVIQDSTLRAQLAGIPCLAPVLLRQDAQIRDDCILAMQSLVKVPAVALMLPMPLSDDAKQALLEIKEGGRYAKNGMCSTLQDFIGDRFF